MEQGSPYPSPQHLAAACTPAIRTERDGEIRQRVQSPGYPHPLAAGSACGALGPQRYSGGSSGPEGEGGSALGWAGALSHSPAACHPSLPQGPVWPGFFSCCYFKISWKQQLSGVAWMCELRLPLPPPQLLPSLEQTSRHTSGGLPDVWPASCR